ncbi:helix-turn-helix domain-containing protein [Patescibacteria group bacterium]|nr:helix-turn-helix domain-containing protein [Patescibacteria group bacterium]MBU1951333.1 helix-turn-helix domain-containing protein [Patescibacteria group bacterium]MBU2236304.1 helix-turn-helix domain-containing protein [Patescibacteria group bacterium]
METALTKELQTLGVTMSEARIYLAILEIGESRVSSIANKTGINRRNIYDSLSTLIDKGLIFQIVGEKEGIYAAVAPEKLHQLIQSKEIALGAVLPDMKKIFQSAKVREKAVIYRGIEGFKKFMQDMLSSETPIRSIGAKGGWGDKKLGDYANWFEQERIKRKIKVYNLFDHEMREVIGKSKPLYNAYGEYRFLPPGFSTNSSVDFFGDTIVIFTGLYVERVVEDVTLSVFVNRNLAESYRIWFQCMWDASSN